MDLHMQQRVEQQYKAFDATKKRFYYTKMKLPKRTLPLEYTGWYTDEWENQGWIYHKPPFARHARVYMFKGPTYDPPYYTQYKCLQLVARHKQYRRIARKVPNYKDRNRAERYITFEYFLRFGAVALISLPIIIPLILWYISSLK